MIIGISPYGNVISDYFGQYALELANRNYKVIIIFDKKFDVSSLPIQKNHLYFSWPSKRPTKFKDFIFFIKILYNYRPYITISNFGSTNIMGIAGWLTRVKYRINYIHTQQQQLSLDAINKRNFWKMMRKKIVYHLQTHFLTNSNGTFNEFRELYPSIKTPFLVSPYLLKPINNSFTKQMRLTRKILIVGRLSPSKGHKALFEQFKFLLEFDPRWDLELIGSGIEYESLKKLAIELGISDSIIFRGNISNEDVCKEFFTATISISPSIHEAFGIVNIESLRAGTPLIMTKTSGGMEIIQENVNGEFFDEKNPHSLTIAVQRIMSDWNSYSKNAIDVYNRKFHGVNIIHQIDDLEKFLKLNGR